MRVTKLATRLRNYDWIAAVIELLIVVVGILIALQVSNWNESRLDRARADSYYRRLHIELLADRHNIDNALVYWNKVSNYGREAIAYGETRQRVDGSNWKTVLAYYQASQLMPFELEATTYSEMRDGGGLALIYDEGLRKQLADYYQLSGTGITANILRHDPVYRTQVRGLTPPGACSNISGAPVSARRPAAMPPTSNCSTAPPRSAMYRPPRSWMPTSARTPCCRISARGCPRSTSAAWCWIPPAARPITWRRKSRKPAGCNDHPDRSGRPWVTMPPFGRLATSADL